MSIVAKGQITITDLNDGINGDNGKTYILNILNGVRSITYNSSGTSPSPSQTAFSCELYEDGKLVTPSSYSWTASGVLSGTSTSSTFTPACSTSFSNANNAVSLTVKYNNQTIRNVVPVSATKIGADGHNAIIGVLSNETHTIPTDASGNNGNYTGANTTIYIYNGATDDSANWTVSATASNVVGSLSGKTYTVTSMSADIGYVDLTASRSGYTNVTKRFTLTKSKAGSNGSAGQHATAYKLISNVAAIGKNLSNVYIPATITISATSATGTAAPKAYAGRFVISETTNGTTFTTKYTSSVNESSKIYTPSAGIKAINAKLYLAGGTTTLLDEQTIPIVSDGATGPQGVPGVQGPAGADGKTYYTWIKYADDASGNGMSDYPDGKKYIGMAYNKTTSVESTTASDYAWALIQGPQGATGANGKTYYTWLKYADTPTSGMSDSPDGKTYMGLAYNKTTATESTNYSDYTWSLIKGTDGVDGKDGKGVQSTTVTYQASTSGTTPPTSTWTTSIPTVSAGQYLWTKTTITYTDNTTSTSYSVGKMGEQGQPGDAGKGIASTITEYQASTSGTTPPTSTWSTSIPSVAAGQYLWTRITLKYTDGGSSVSYSVSKMGETGKGISQVKNYYLATSASSGVTTSTTGWTETVQTMTATNKYLWNYERIIYTSGSDTLTTPSIIGTFAKDGTDGKGISSIVEYYLVSPNNTGVTTSTSGWVTTVPVMTTTNKYLWNYEVINYTTGSPTTSTPKVIGAYGNTGPQGATGATGVGVKSADITYQVGTSGTTAPTGTWTSTIPTVSAGQYLWTRTVITYTNSTTSTSYSVGKMGEQGKPGNDGKGISSTTTEYQVSSSGTTPPTSTWSTSIPSASAGQFLWTRITIKYTDSTTSTSYSVSKMGETGKGISQVKNYYLATSAASGVTTSTSGWTEAVQTMTATNKYLWNYERIVYTSGSDTVTAPTIIGTYAKDGTDGKGISSIVEYYLVSSSASGVTTSTSGWSTTVPSMTTTNKYLWNYEVINYTTGSPTTSTPKVIGVYGNTGPQGPTGATGATGKGVKATIVDYQASTSGTTPPTGSWVTSIPSVAAGQYLWTRMTITYTDNSTSISYSVGKMGEQGKQGNAGKGISSTTTEYQASTSGTTPPTSTWSTSVPTVAAGQFLWTRITIKYTDSTTSTSYSVGKMGAQGPQGTAGKGIKSTDVAYQAWTSGTTVPTGAWQATVPSVSAGQFLWTKTTITYTDNTTSVSYSVGKMGEKGSTGNTGAPGTGVSSITTEYYLSTRKDTPTGGSWSETPKQWSTGMYLWTRSRIVYTNPASTVYTTPMCDNSWEAVNDFNTQQNIFNTLTNNGQTQGIYMQNSKLYLNGEYLKAGTVSADKLVIGVGEGGGLCQNPSFKKWSGTYPDGTVAWSSGGISKQTVDGRNVAQFTCSTSGTQYGMQLPSAFYANNVNLDGIEFFALEVKFRLTSGTNPSGAAFLFDIYATDNTYQRLQLNMTEAGTTLTANTWYTVKKVFQASAAKTFKSCSGYLLANWSGAGNAVKTIQFATANVYIASKQDFLTQTWTTGTEINGNSIKTGTLSAVKITTGTLDASKVAVTNLNASNITSGTIKAALINADTLRGKEIIGGTVSGGKVTGATISGGSLTIGSGFSVNTSGVLTATGANITGTINATSGNFSGNITSSAIISGGTIKGARVESSYYIRGDYPEAPHPDEDGAVGYSRIKEMLSNKSDELNEKAMNDIYDYNYSVSLSGANLRSSVSRTYMGDPSSGIFYNTLDIWGSNLTMVSGYSPGNAEDDVLVMSPTTFKMQNGMSGSYPIKIDIKGDSSTVRFEEGIEVESTENHWGNIYNYGIIYNNSSVYNHSYFYLQPTSQAIYTAMLKASTTDGNVSGDKHTHIGYKEYDGKFSHYFRGLGGFYIDNEKGAYIEKTLAVKDNLYIAGTSETAYKCLTVSRYIEGTWVEAKYAPYHVYNVRDLASTGVTYVKRGASVLSQQSDYSQNILIVLNNAIIPGWDNGLYCGVSSHRFAAIHASTGTVYSSSKDEKNNIQPINIQPLDGESKSVKDIIKDAIKETNIYSYSYNTLENDDVFVGFIGQELEEQSPEFFRLIGGAYDKEDGARQYDIREASLLGVLWSAIQDALLLNEKQEEQIKELQDEVKELRNDIAEIKNKLNC